VQPLLLLRAFRSLSILTMAKMLLAMLSLAVLAAASDTTDCAVDGAKAVDQATDAAIFIWAATRRCGNPKNEKVKCAMDITSAATAAGNMANIIVAALDECGVIKTDNKDCGMLAGELTASVAGLASMTAGMVDSCHPNQFEGHDNDPKDAVVKLGSLERDTSLGKCIIDAKDTLASIFDAVASLKNLEEGATEHNALNTVTALASLGHGVAGAVFDCSVFANGKGNTNALCASRTLGAVAELHRVADLAESMAVTCEASASASRLYLQNGKNTAAMTKNSMSLTLAAFLPVAAVLGFVFGRRFGKARANRDIEPMIQGESE
jgi:hypothetical protein